MPTTLAKVVHQGGRGAESNALRNALTNSGITDQRNDKSFGEELLFGISGGIGAGYFMFQYKGMPGWAYVAGRHLWQDNVAYYKNVCARLGLSAKFSESSGAKGALDNLRKALETGPAIAWCDLASLPYYGAPPFFKRGGYHIITVYSIDEAKGTALMGDRAKPAVTINLDDLAASRGAITSYKNRLLSITPGKRPVDIKTAVADGIRACYTELAKGRIANFRLDAFKNLASAMNKVKAKDGWPKALPPGQALFGAQLGFYLFIERYGTGGGLYRAMYADFLEEAAVILAKKELASVAKEYRALARQWSGLAQAMLPTEIKPFKESRDLIDDFEKTLLAKGGDAAKELAKIVNELTGIYQTMRTTHPFVKSGAEEFYASLGERMNRIHEDEVTALAALQKAVPAK
jgi:hypothetical protein